MQMQKQQQPEPSQASDSGDENEVLFTPSRSSSAATPSGNEDHSQMLTAKKQRAALMSDQVWELLLSHLLIYRYDSVCYLHAC